MYNFHGDELWKTGCRCCLERKAKTERGERMFEGKALKGRCYKMTQGHKSGKTNLAHWVV